MNKICLMIISLTLLAFNLNAQNVNIPDANFKNYLVNNTSINTNGDNEIQVSEANSFNGSISCSNLGITDLTGIEAFTKVIYLDCSYNQLTSLDITNNLKLESLACANNQLANLDLYSNIKLVYLYCRGNQLLNIDASNNVKLVYLNCTYNQITNLDVSNSINLNRLYCDYNELTTLDVSNSKYLKDLYCSYNDLVGINTFSNTLLNNLVINNNQLTYLDVSNNIYLKRLRCFFNELTHLNIKNGNNQNMIDTHIDINPNLYCVEVDDPVYSTANWTRKDSQTSYGINCNTNICTVSIPDANFKNYLVNNSLINTNGDNEIQCDEATDFTGIINCSNLGITDVTGLEAFTNITRLDCSKNQLTNLDISTNTSLRYLNCNTNQLTSLDVSNNLGVRILICSKNQLTSIDVTANTALVNLSCNENLLTNLDVSTNTNLKYLNCKLNQLSTLDVSNNSMLDIFYCGNNQITTLDVSNNSRLRYFNSKSSLLENLNMANGQNSSIVSFDIKNNPNLTCVKVDNVVYSNNSWINKDIQTSYGRTCSVSASMRSNEFSDVTMYPNPAKEIVYINSNETVISKIEILDFSSRVLKKYLGEEKGINISDLKSGMYFVKIYSKENFIIKRLIKE